MRNRKRIAETKERHKNLKEKPLKTFFVIITDGHENASREFETETIKKMIEEQEKEYGWNFVFLGADQNAFDAAHCYGISLDSTLSYSSRGGTKRAFTSVSTSCNAAKAAVKNYIDSLPVTECNTAGGSLTDGDGIVIPDSNVVFTDEDRQDQVDAGLDPGLV